MTPVAGTATGPSTELPLYTVTATDCSSPPAVPAAPLILGVGVLVGELSGAIETTGATVSTLNVTGLDLPVGLPSELCCSAVAVYSPLGSGGLAGPEVH